MHKKLEEVTLYAWVGEDEFGSGEIGLKQGIVPSGCIPLVAVREDKINRSDLSLQLQSQATAYGKTIQLCRFKFDGVIRTLEPGQT